MGHQSTLQHDPKERAPFPFNILEAISTDGSLLHPLVLGVFTIGFIALFI